MREIEDIYPLSPMQQGMVFHSLMAPESGVYVEVMGFTLRGDLDVEAFARAWQTVVDRHSILRTAFVWEGVDEPLQAVFGLVEIALDRQDWRGLAPAEQVAKRDEFLANEQRRGFRLDEAPLMRLTLIRTGEDEWEFVWAHHHALLDGWSAPILFNELFAAYEIHRTGRGDISSLPAAHPYRDYIAWLRQRDFSAAERYWRELLAGFASPTSLAIDRPGKSPGGGAWAGHGQSTIQLPAEITEALQAMSRSHQLTLSTIVQGAWAILLHRYSGESDIVYGVTVSGRPAELPGAEMMVGLFINTLPARLRFDHDPTVLDLLKDLQRQQVEARQYEYSSLVQIQGWSEIPRHQPLFDSIFVFENYPVEESLGSSQGALEIKEIRALEQTNYPLTVVCYPGNQLAIDISYRRDQFEEGAIRRMLGHLGMLLEGMAAHPECRPWELALLTEEERRLTIEEWNRTEAPYPFRQCVHELFEDQAENGPDDIAIVHDGRQLTYAELNRQANRLAHYLRGLGVGPETLVAVQVERSIELAIGLLGILKAGGAYLPVDPAYPAERQAWMMGDSQAALLLTQERLLGRLPEHSARVICLDRDWPGIARESSENPGPIASPDNLAYVIYTSGSTGKPKGAMIEHRGVVNYLTWCRQAYPMAEGTGSVVHSSISFDLTVTSLFAPLVSGKRVVLVREDLGVEALSEALKREKGLSLIKITPAHLELLSRQVAPEEAAERTHSFVIGGENLLSEQISFWQTHAPETVLFNEYGPTETVVGCCVYRVPEGGAAGGVIPIGRPIINTSLYILDERGQPVPIGVTGELYIGGIGVGRGYLNRPDLTAERFLPDPFSEMPGARMYKTGDLARYRGDGNIECLGRSDDQVKVRGYRVELGEIESVLREHPSIENAAVAVRRKPDGDRQLVAYVVTGQGSASPQAEWRQHLLRQLPEYMVPSIYLVLTGLPMSPNGKVNRRALPEPEWESVVSANRYLAPRTPSEELMCGIWAQVLGLERVGLDDDFFELGGHSLLATQLISRAREAFEVELPLKSLFEHPTVRELTERVEALRREAGGVAAPAIQARGREGELPLSFSQQRLWFLDQLEPESPYYNNPLALRLRGNLDVEILEQCLNRVVARHEVLRTTFETRQGRPIQVIAPSLTLSLPVEDLRNLPEAEREAVARRLAGEEALTPFDLSRGPMLRARLLRLRDDDHVLLSTMHHIVSDGWSMNVLIGEVTSIYQALLAREDPALPALPALPIQYADYAQWQRDWLRGEVLEKQLGYWTGRLAGRPTVLELPTDHPRPAVQSSHGAQFDFTLAPDLARQLKELSRREGATLFMTLLAAFQTLLHRYTGQDEINVGTPIANRTREEIEGLIGFFVNTLVMPASLGGNPSFVELLEQVRETALGAYMHQDLPFEQLVEALQPERDLSHTPLFQVMFMLQNTPRSGVELPGLAVTPFDSESRTARFDLTVEMNEGPEGLYGAIEYNTDLFEEETVARMACHFETLLGAIVADPEQAVDLLPVMTDGEMTEISETWNRTEAPYPSDSCFHRLFEEQVHARPEAVALAFEGQSVSYRELNDRANRLARYLSKQGVGPETIVGLCVERSIEMIVGLMGIMKAGGAYLPLDPNYPSDRLAFMFGDSQAPVLITQESLVDKLPANGARIVRIDSEWEAIARESGDPIESGVGPENLAYVIYTSGSTGRPKGTLLEHRGLCNLAVAQQGMFGVREGKSVLQFSPFSFDASVWEVAMSLGSGARLVLARQEQLASMEDLHALLKDERISVVTLPASVLRVLATEGLTDLEVAIAAGERCTRDLVERWRPGRRFFNCYGPTETTVCATAEECVEIAGEDPPIGRPLPNTEIFVLDRNRQIVPVGVPGELYVGGVCLARGYLRRDEMTREKFIRHPFSPERNARLYRTGDLVRFRADGRIEYLGRVDEQVKVRGYRIELGEIEAVLREHPAVHAAAVAARDDVRGDQRLVGYIVPAGDEMPGAAELREHLRRKLPEYMAPAIYVRVEQIPLSPSGKVDRKALPEPDSARPDLAREYIAPRTETERALAAIWSELLGVERVGAEDSFFELGGHSLLATQVMSRVRESMQVEIPLRELFEAPTLAGLAAAIDAAPKATDLSESPAIVPVSREARRMKRSALGSGAEKKK